MSIFVLCPVVSVVLLWLACLFNLEKCLVVDYLDVFKILSALYL